MLKLNEKTPNENIYADLISHDFILTLLCDVKANPIMQTTTA